jgi:CheY-like chemotaxis protein
MQTPLDNQGDAGCCYLITYRCRTTEKTEDTATLLADARVLVGYSLFVACAFKTDVRHPVTQRETGRSAKEDSAMTTPRVFLADDQAEMLQTVAQVLEGQFKVVGTAEDGARAFELAPTLSPDVLVLDISMPVMDGIEVALRLRTQGSTAKVVFLSVHEDTDFVEAAMSAGALGYVLKPCLATDLVPAIWKALEGNTFVSSPFK